METRISSGLLQRVIALADADPTREVCGLLLGRPGAIEVVGPARNMHPEPARQFELDPAVHFAALRAARGGGAAVIGHYHSHPSGLPEPSATDAALALEIDLLWLIVGGGAARLWRVSQPGTFVPERLTIVAAGGCTRMMQPPQGPARTRDGP